MQIYIPTRGRALKQRTFNDLPRKWKDNTVLVVPSHEADQYVNYPHVAFPYKDSTTVGDVRQWIINTTSSEHIVMLDDDIAFAARREDDPTKFRNMTEQDYDEMFGQLDDVLHYYAHAGVLAREGGNRITDEFVYATRMMRVLAYDVTLLREEGVKFNRIPVMEDFDVTLQLLRLGLKNCILCNWVQNNSGGSNAPGGCSLYRTPALQTQAANKLAELHHPHVKVVEKTTKTAWGGQKRTDVRVSWKQALAEGERAYANV